MFSVYYYQIIVFVVVFPRDCDNYYGNKSNICYRSIFLQNCVDDGPPFLTRFCEIIPILNTKTLK